MTLQDIFDQLLLEPDGGTYAMAARDYNTLRASLLRKYKSYADQCADMDLTHYKDMYVQCVFKKNAEDGGLTGTASFKLVSKAASLRVRKNYVLVGL